MDGKTITSYLRQLCRDLDAGRPLRPFRRAVAVAAIGVASVGCAPAAPEPRTADDEQVVVPADGEGPIVIEPEPVDGGPPEPAPVALYAVPYEPTAPPAPLPPPIEPTPVEPISPPVALYGVPIPAREDCSNNLDDDLDGAIDCADTDCPCAVALYAAPPPVHVRPPEPPPVALYAVPSPE